MTDLSSALEHYKAGRWTEAQEVCEALLTARPHDERALHLAGAIAAQTGQVEQAIELLRRATRTKPDFTDAWIDLARLLTLANRSDETLECWEAVARLRPDAQLLASLAGEHQKRHQHDNAAVYYEKATQLNPSDARFWTGLSMARLNLKQFPAAEQAAREAIRLAPKLADGHLNLGAALHQQRRVVDAIASYQTVLSLDPRQALAHANLADAYLRLDQLDDSLAAAKKAVEVDPQSAAGWNNLATVLILLGRDDESLAASGEAIALDPTDHSAHANAGMVLLSRGEFREGWSHYDWRIREWPNAATRAKTWDGSPLNGKSIALRAEQGFGDTIQFIRYAKLVRDQRGGRVIIECPAELKPLLQTAAGVDQVVAWGEPAPPVDAEIFMMSLPHRFGATLETIPADVPYLRHDPERAARLQQKLGAKCMPRVGVVWAGNPNHVNDRRRSCPLSELAPLRDTDVQLISLQKGPAAERERALIGELKLLDLGNECHDFADLAAAISLLDLLITVDTAPAHLAGALAKKTWLVLPHHAEWRWMRGRDDSPWYPTMRLFRQPSDGDWASVVHMVVDRLNSGQI